MPGPTESERLYVVETKLDTVLHAVEKTNTELASLSTALTRYATRTELEQAIADRNAKISELKAMDERIARRHSLTVWLTGTMSAAAGVGITLLINMAFS